MIELNFVVDKNVLARCILYRDLLPKNTANILWEKYRQSYMELHKNPFDENINEQILQELQEVSFFNKYVAKAENYKQIVQNQWSNNKEKINQFLRGILKTEPNVEQITAYIVDPAIATGKTKNGVSFVYSHWIGEKDEIYNLVYLTHEAMHAYFYQMGIGFLHSFNESLVEFITDIELVRYLTDGKQKYETHSENMIQKVKMYPYWNLYLNRPKQELIKLMQEDGIKYEIDKYEYLRERLSAMDIFEFAKFLEENNEVFKTQKVKCSYDLL